MDIVLTIDQINQKIAALEAEYAETERSGQQQLDRINAEIARLQQMGQQVQGETIGKMNNLRGRITELQSLLPATTTVPNELLQSAVPAGVNGNIPHADATPQ